MTNKGPGASSEWTAGDLLRATDLLDSMQELRFTPSLYFGITMTGFIGHSATIYSLLSADGTIYNSTDSGVTWTSKSTVADTNSFIRICRGTVARGIVVETTATAETVFTSDSGATWTAATSASFATQINDVDFPVSGLIVVGGDDDVGAKHIVFSTDSGTTWTDATTAPTTKIAAVSMLDGTTGYAIGVDGLMWKTTNAAVTWTSTTHDIGAVDESAGSSIFTLTSTTVAIAYVISGSAACRISLYDNTAGTFTTKWNMGGLYTRIFGLQKMTDGALITGYVHDSNGKYVILRSTDSGVTWSMSSEQSIEINTAIRNYKCAIGEYGSNKCAMAATSNLVKFNMA